MIEYAAKLEVADDGVNVTFRDFEDVFTCGATVEEALANAEDVLNLMIEHYIEDGRELPEPTFPEIMEVMIVSKFK
jgi:antitoxin HicB